MAEADLMVGGGGATTWERMCLGLPAIVISIADNQIQVNKSLAAAGFIVYAGEIDTIRRFDLYDALIYCLNKKTGDKVAAYKALSIHENRETSFWDMSDTRIDSIESGLPNEIMEIIYNEFINVKKTNWELLSEDEANTQLLWIQRNSYEKAGREEPMRLTINGRVIEDYVEEADLDDIVIPNRIRIVPPIPHETSNDDAPPIRS
jgi:hypothetical protein